MPTKEETAILRPNALNQKRLILFTTDQNTAVSGGWRFPWQGGGYGERWLSLSYKMGSAPGTLECHFTRQHPALNEAQLHPQSERTARPGWSRKPAQPNSTQFSLETGHLHTVPVSPPSLRPCSLPTTRPRVPWTDLLPFPAFSAGALIENLGGLAYLFSWNAVGYIFMVFSQQCSVSISNYNNKKKSQSPSARKHTTEKKEVPGLTRSPAFMNCN